MHHNDHISEGSRSAVTGPAANRNGLRVLAVQSDPVCRKLLDSYCRLLGGYSVVTASNGEEALEAVRRQDFDIVFMDLSMPKMDGIEATRAIRDLHPGLPIICISAHAYEHAISNCLDSGMDAYIVKPYMPEELFQAVEQVLGNRPVH